MWCLSSWTVFVYSWIAVCMYLLYANSMVCFWGKERERNKIFENSSSSPCHSTLEVKHKKGTWVSSFLSCFQCYTPLVTWAASKATPSFCLFICMSVYLHNYLPTKHLYGVYSGTVLSNWRIRPNLTWVTTLQSREFYIALVFIRLC